MAFSSSIFRSISERFESLYSISQSTLRVYVHRSWLSGPFLEHFFNGFAVPRSCKSRSDVGSSSGFTKRTRISTWTYGCPRDGPKCAYMYVRAWGNLGAKMDMCQTGVSIPFPWLITCHKGGTPWIQLTLAPHWAVLG